MGRFDPLWSRPYYRDPAVIVAAYLAVATWLVAVFVQYPEAALGGPAALGIGVFVATALIGAGIRKLVRRRAASRETERRRAQR